MIINTAYLLLISEYMAEFSLKLVWNCTSQVRLQNNAESGWLAAAKPHPLLYRGNVKTTKLTYIYMVGGRCYNISLVNLLLLLLLYGYKICHIYILHTQALLILRLQCYN